MAQGRSAAWREPVAGFLSLLSTYYGVTYHPSVLSYAFFLQMHGQLRRTRLLPETPWYAISPIMLCALADAILDH